jgi:phosphatidylglycerophosphate synthase
VNSHTVGKQADWEKVEPSEWNVFQRWASRTNGILTPGNVVTVLGAVTVTSGLIDIHRGETRKGTYKVGAGRLLDILDGIVADVTKTKSPLGEALDATVDKIVMLGILRTLYKKEVINKETYRHILRQNLANVAITGAAKLIDAEIHPSVEGKHTMLCQGTSLGLYSLARANEEEGNLERAKELELGAQIFELAAVKLGRSATDGYMQDLAA